MGWQEALAVQAQAVARRRRRLRKLVASAGGALAALLVFLGLYLVRGPGPSSEVESLLEEPAFRPTPVLPEPQCPPLLARGGALRPGQALESQSAPVALGSHTGDLLVLLGPGTRVRRNRSSRWDLALEQGQALVDVHGRRAAACLAVHTPRGTVRVLGTRFLVAVVPGGVRVAVFRGRVEVRDGGRRLLVRAGRSSLVVGGSVREGPAGREPEWAGSLAAGRLKGSGRMDCSPRAIRREAARRGARRALALVERCRRAGRWRGEASLLEAELLARAGQARRAVRLLHVLARRYRGRSVGQDALFLAGQMEWTRLGARASAERTFRRYLKWYPGGRYAGDARRLLRLLASRRRVGR